MGAVVWLLINVAADVVVAAAADGGGADGKKSLFNKAIITYSVRNHLINTSGQCPNTIYWESKILKWKSLKEITHTYKHARFSLSVDCVGQTEK